MLPFQRSASGTRSSLTDTSPTASQNLAAEHDTPFSELRAASGVLRIAHAVPFHVSATASKMLSLISSPPTAAHGEGDGRMHDTAPRPLAIEPAGTGGDCRCQDGPPPPSGPARAVGPVSSTVHSATAPTKTDRFMPITEAPPEMIS